MPAVAYVHHFGAESHQRGSGPLGHLGPRFKAQYSKRLQLLEVGDVGEAGGV